MSERELYANQFAEGFEKEPSPEDRDAMTSIAVLNALTKLAAHKRLIAGATSLAAIVGLICSLSLTPKYQATTRIMPPRQTQSTTSLLNSMPGVGSLGDIASGGLSLKDPNAIYIGLLKSRPIADAIITKFGLQKVYGSRDMTAARKALEANTLVLSEKSDLISIAVKDSDKTRAAGIANDYTAELRLLTKDISVAEASKRSLFFEEQLKQAKEDMVTAEVGFQQVQQNKGLVHLDAQAGLVAVNAASVRGEIAAKQVELQALRSYSTERNPDVQLAEQELIALQREGSRLQHNTDSSEFSGMGLKDMPKAGLDYVRAQRELQYRQAFFDLLLKQYEAARLDEGKDAAVIQVVEPGIPPDRKYSPNRPLIVLVFAWFGFLSSCLHLHVLGLVRKNPEISRSMASFRAALASR
ncbi:MAG: Wzz/FepE/Etk N-terminal domain-containing protein [Terracidiphilus sp.]